MNKFKRLNHFIDDKLTRRLLRFFASAYPSEVIDRIVDDELQGRGVYTNRVRKSLEWLKGIGE